MSIIFFFFLVVVTLSSTFAVDYFVDSESGSDAAVRTSADAAWKSLTENVVFENNVCVDAGFGWGHVQRPDKNGRHVMIYNNQAKTKNLVIRNNVFCNASDSLVRIESDFRDGMSMEGNTYWQPDGGEVVRWLNKQRYKTGDFRLYQEEIGLDKTSTLQKPDLKRHSALPENFRDK